jgi:hypothetical protein
MSVILLTGCVGHRLPMPKPAARELGEPKQDGSW